MLTSIVITNKTKLNKIIALLKKADRTFFFDKFYDEFCGTSYILWYSTI